MIGVCTKCNQTFETTTEDAYSPDRLCAACYSATLPRKRDQAMTPTLETLRLRRVLKRLADAVEEAIDDLKAGDGGER
jgi:hypothetical protein